MTSARPKMIPYILPLIALATIVIFGANYWYEEKIADLPYFGAASTIESKSASHYTVPGFLFVNQDGASLDTSFIKGKIWVVHYFFRSCPSICPKMMTDMQQVAKACQKEKNVRLISLTVDPGEDTPEQLKNYAAEKHIDAEKWQLGTGNKKDLYRFARKALFITATDGDGGDNDFIHSDRLVLIDQQRHIRGYYDGTSPAATARLIADIQRLNSEN